MHSELLVVLKPVDRELPEADLSWIIDNYATSRPNEVDGGMTTNRAPSCVHVNRAVLPDPWSSPGSHSYH